MIVIIHVVIAVLSVVVATIGYSRPTNATLRMSYGLVVLTFGSGFFLVWNEPTQILRTCLSGIGYLAVVLAAIVLTRKKLAGEVEADQQNI